MWSISVGSLEVSSPRAQPAPWLLLPLPGTYNRVTAGPGRPQSVMAGVCPAMAETGHRTADVQAWECELLSVVINLFDFEGCLLGTIILVKICLTQG